MTVITKKSYPELFEKVLSGDKTFDLRVADFDCRPGDILEQVEVNHNGTPTGRRICHKVGYVLQTKDVDFYEPNAVEQYGYQVISLISEAAV